MKSQLLQTSAGSREWYINMKNQQGSITNHHIPPLNGRNGICTSSADKAQLQADHFAEKMTVKGPDGCLPKIRMQTNKSLESNSTTERAVLNDFRSLDTAKACGLDSISPHPLKNCAEQLASPLGCMFSNCLKQNRWPVLWKMASVVLVHKRGSKNEVNSYRSISLLLTICKVFERLIASVILAFFNENSLLNNRQFGFRDGKSASNLLLNLSSD